MPTEDSLWLLHFNQAAAGKEFGMSPATIKVKQIESYAGECWVIVEQAGQPLRHLYPGSFVGSIAEKGGREVYAIPLMSPIACPACNRLGEMSGKEGCESCGGSGWINGLPKMASDTRHYRSLRQAVRQYATMDSQGQDTATIRSMMTKLAKQNTSDPG